MIEITKDTYKVFEEHMDKALENLKANLNSVRAGRANPHVLDRLSIDYYGVQTPLTQVANIQVPEARMLTITPWDPSTLTLIEKAIQTSDVGINPANDGKMIRLVFPTLTEERRKDLAKSVSKYGEETKVVIRNIRRDAIDYFKGIHKSKDISDDQLHGAEEQIQKITNKYTDKVDQMIELKEKDLMEI